MNTKKTDYLEISTEDFIYHSKVSASRAFAKYLDSNHISKKQKSNLKTYTF